MKSRPATGPATQPCRISARYLLVGTPIPVSLSNPGPTELVVGTPGGGVGVECDVGGGAIDLAVRAGRLAVGDHALLVPGPWHAGQPAAARAATGLRWQPGGAVGAQPADRVAPAALPLEGAVGPDAE